MCGSAEVHSKTCSACTKDLPITAFNKQSKSVDGHQAYCRDCQSEHKRWIRYGVTTKWVNQKMEEQNGECAVCAISLEEYLKVYAGKRKHFDIDHCHTTGKPRALLCNRCNMVLGQVDDNIGLLKHLQRYLRKHMI